jgi:hypothetical protein
VLQQTVHSHQQASNVLHFTQHLHTSTCTYNRQPRLLHFLHIISWKQVVTSCDLNDSHGPQVTTGVNLKGVHEHSV